MTVYSAFSSDSTQSLVTSANNKEVGVNYSQLFIGSSKEARKTDEKFSPLSNVLFSL